MILMLTLQAAVVPIQAVPPWLQKDTRGSPIAADLKAEAIPYPGSQTSRQAKPGPVQVVKQVFYTEMKCNVDWNQRCAGDVKMTAWNNWNVCNVFYSPSAGRNAVYGAYPTDWIVNDPESPDRFRSGVVYVNVAGSGDWWDRWSSHVTLTNVGLEMISGFATNADRIKYGCLMPAHD